MDDLPIPRRPVGRPRKIAVERAVVEGVTCDEHVDRLIEALGGNVEALRIKSKQTTLTDKEVMQVGRLARTLETCAQAKRHLLEATKGDGDLSGIPTEQLARVVVRAMKTDHDLKAAIAAELKTKAD
jgi:hypothetical protein